MSEMTRADKVGMVADFAYLYMALSMVDDDPICLEKDESWACLREWGECVQADSTVLDQGWGQARKRIAHDGCSEAALDKCVRAMKGFSLDVLEAFLNDLVRIAVVDGRIYEKEKDFCNWAARSFGLPEPFDYELSPGSKYALVGPSSS